MFNKKLLAASMVAAVSVGMATQANAMKMQENNLGQLLLSPIYITSGDIKTDIIVVNTRTDAAIKAKIVFREGKNSSEVLDFILYLTPGDVWRGSVTGEMDAAFMDSTDDSMTDASGEFASEDNPVHQKFYDKEDSGSNGFGHFEVIGAYSITEGITNVFSSIDENNPYLIAIKQGMDKRDLKNVFDTIFDAGGNKNVIGGTAFASSVDPRHLQMMGEVQVLSGSTGLFNFEIPALGPDFYYAGMEFDTSIVGNKVIENTFYDVSFGADSLIGFAMGPFGTDNINRIEKAIASKDTSFEYNVDNSDVVAPVVSFVTKYRHRGEEDAHGVTRFCTGGSGEIEKGERGNYSAPFKNTQIGEMVYQMISFDNSENSEEVTDNQFSGTDIPDLELPLEVNILTPSYYSTSGWANLIWKPRPACDYLGVPALSATLKTKGATLLWTENADRRNDGLNFDIPE